MTRPDMNMSKDDAERVRKLADELAWQAMEIAKQAEGAGYHQDYMDKVYATFFGNITLLGMYGRKYLP